MVYKPYKDIRIPKGYKPEARKAIAEDIIDFIINRSLKGKDVNQENFAPYSKEYIKSKDFKLAGKGKKPNLRLSFDMLNSLDLRSHEAGNLRIGIDANDKTNQDKAEGNETGSYGKSSGSRKKARKFIGIKREDLNEILSKYPLRDRKLLGDIVSAAQTRREAAAELADDVETAIDE